MKTANWRMRTIKDEQQIKIIAQEVRAWAEHIQKQTMNLFSSNLLGLCAISSAYLFCKLKEAGIETHIVSNHKHCFLITKDDFVVDVTATQFGFEKILITPHSEIINFSSYYFKREIHDSVDSLHLTQIKHGWPAHQTVNPVDNQLALVTI